MKDKTKDIFSKVIVILYSVKLLSSTKVIPSGLAACDWCNGMGQESFSKQFSAVSWST